MRFRAEVLIELKRICQQWVQEAGAIFDTLWWTNIASENGHL